MEDLKEKILRYWKEYFPNFPFKVDVQITKTSQDLICTKVRVLGLDCCYLLFSPEYLEKEENLERAARSAFLLALINLIERDRDIQVDLNLLIKLLTLLEITGELKID